MPTTWSPDIWDSGRRRPPGNRGVDLPDIPTDIPGTSIEDPIPGLTEMLSGRKESFRKSLMNAVNRGAAATRTQAQGAIARQGMGNTAIGVNLARKLTAQEGSDRLNAAARSEAFEAESDRLLAQLTTGFRQSQMTDEVARINAETARHTGQTGRYSIEEQSRQFNEQLQANLDAMERYLAELRGESGGSRPRGFSEGVALGYGNPGRDRIRGPVQFSLGR